MRRIPVVTSLAAGAVLALSVVPNAASADPKSSGWQDTVKFKERVSSSPTTGGGYPGAAPAPGDCVEGNYDSNFSEAFIALRPHSEQLVGGAKAFFDKWSTFKSSHTVSFAMGKNQDTTHMVTGFDCISTGTQDMPPSWTNVTDPNVVWDTKGRVHQLIMAYNAYWGSVKEPNGDIYGVYSDDGGKTWTTGNGGAAIHPGPELSVDSDFYLDKPWIAANQIQGSDWVDHIYGVWVLFTDSNPELYTAVTRDRGKTWDDFQKVETPNPLGGKNPWPMIGVDKDGTVYLSYVTYGATSADKKTVPATLWTARSTDDGKTWSGFDKAVNTTAVATGTLPGVKQHRSIVQYQAVAPDRSGHLYVAYNEVNANGDVDVKLITSIDGGQTWSDPVLVNDDGGKTNQFSATVAAGPDGAVAVGFYDMRAACPSKGKAVLPQNYGKSGTCIGLTLQGFRDEGGSVKQVGHNVLASKHLWDPNQPGQTRDGIKQVACENPQADCQDIFIGDYFSMAISEQNVYTMSSSTSYPSKVKADGGGKIYYQQQLLTTVSRDALGVD